MALVCEQCRNAFRLDSAVEIVVKSATDDVMDSSTAFSSEKDSEANKSETKTLSDVEAKADGLASITENKREGDHERDEDSDDIECEVKSKRPKLSTSPAHLADTTPTDSAHGQYCVACLGTLDESLVAAIASCIPSTIQQQGYTGLKSFCIAIHTPLSLMIRRMGMEKYIQKQNGDQKSEYVTLEGYVKEELRSRLKEKLEGLLSLPYNTESPFQIVVKLHHSRSLEECQVVAKMYPDLFIKIAKRRHFKNRRNVKEEDITIVPVRKALEISTIADLSQHGYLLSPVQLQCSYVIELLHKPIYIAGRYNKYSRCLPQTPWMVDGVKKVESSVQELICEELCRLTGSTDYTFFASGREDVDVRMLGTGRPFAVEINNPRNVCLCQEDIDRAQELVNKSTQLVAIQRLTEVSKEETSLLKEGEAEKSKQYCALVWSETEVTAQELECLERIKDLKIAQKTPIRVLHRRSLATRERTVYSMHSEVVDSHRFKLYLCSQAGTYIKEFVHSDFGRTKPSLGEVLSGRKVDILSLDVTDVQLEWPPSRRSCQ